MGGGGLLPLLHPLRFLLPVAVHQALLSAVHVAPAAVDSHRGQEGERDQHARPARKVVPRRHLRLRAHHVRLPHAHLLPPRRREPARPLLLPDRPAGDASPRPPREYDCRRRDAGYERGHDPRAQGRRRRHHGQGLRQAAQGGREHRADRDAPAGAPDRGRGPAGDLGGGRARQLRVWV